MRLLYIKPLPLKPPFQPNKFKSKFPFTNRSKTPNQSRFNLFSCRTKMASSMSILLKRAAAPAPTILSKLSNPIRSASVSPLVSRSFNTNSQVTSYDQDESSVPVGRGTADRSPSRRRDLGSPFFSDVFDPFSPTRSLSQVLNMVDQFMDNPFLAGLQGGSRRGWDVKENEEALFLRMDMPGLDKEDVKISVEQNMLVVKGEGKDLEDEDGGARRFSSRLELPPNLYKIDSIRAEMKNGVLKLVIPKAKEEERKDVFEVKVQ
ncbi:hypothetical protein ACFX15_037142 [Malus domestica]|uniref:SHSP domain-containing protein n=1 Tax=Malus domestica TaxID=3750 RepID=A0A498JQS5_MALDO|nr:small heat shock protein, chloroplastic-like [Malus sylvestris]RXH97267.1 hypothetical protein DVH24_035935 [Malus domestica]